MDESFFSLFALIPRSHLGAAQIHSVSQHREGLPSQLQLWTLCLSWLRPAEGTLFQPFAQHPQTRPIKIKHFDSGMAPVTKDVERSAARILSKTAVHQPVQTVEALAHVAAVDQQKNLQALDDDAGFGASRPASSI
jgi:hypothetical protein